MTYRPNLENMSGASGSALLDENGTIKGVYASGGNQGNWEVYGSTAVRYEFAELDRAVAESARKGFIKVLTPPGKDKILGVTIVSEHAGDLLAEFVIAMKHDLGLNKILGTIHAYPTWAEGAKYAAGNWKRANAPEKLLGFVEKFHTLRITQSRKGCFYIF